jgi:competence protein ComEC
VCEGDRLTLGIVHAIVLTPRCDGAQRAVTGDPDNDNAISMLVRVADVTALIPSDVEAEVLLQVPTLRRELSRDGPLDVLVVSHHGSRDAGLDSFLAMARPQVAVIPVGQNSYGHPAPETLSSLKSAGVRVFRTDHDGSIQIGASKAGKLNVRRVR